MTQCRIQKSRSRALMAFAATHEDVEFEQGHALGGDPKDTLYVADAEGNYDAYYVVEMEDGTFFADCNYTTDDLKPRSAEDVADALIAMLRDAQEMGIEDLGSIADPNDTPLYRGAYFSTIEAAYEAVKTWSAGAEIPKCYNPPITD